MITILLVIVLQQQPTVSITLAPDKPAIIMPRTDAEAQFKRLCKDGTDDKKLRALAAELNPMPDWSQMVMNKEPSVCNRNPKPIVLIPLK